MKSNSLNDLIPFKSTHFQWKLGSVRNIVTQNKIYPILEWGIMEGGYPIFSFLNDRGEVEEWGYAAGGVKDCPFHRNLKEILE